MKALLQAMVDRLHILATKQVLIPLTAFREVTSNGDVGNIVANGGVLASDTTPIYRADTNKSHEISWAAANVDPIAVQLSLPSDFDGSQDVTVSLEVYTDNTGGGGVNAATFSLETSWDGEAVVTDTATDETPATTVHTITATIAAADIPDGATRVTVQLTPAAHADDPIQLVSASLTYASTAG